MRKIAALAVLALSAIAYFGLGGTTAAYACSKAESYDLATPQANADGARMKWVLRQLTATDWSSGGFSAQVIWVGTNNYDPGTDWVELGATQGWQGQNIYTYYTASGTAGGGYSEQRITAITPTYGTTHRFASFKNAITPDYWAAIDSNGYWSWPFKLPYTPGYAGGLEVTCGETGKVNRTYVSENQFRRASDATWITVSNGSLGSFGVAGTVGWCSAPVTFKYWMRSDIDTSICA